MPLGFTLVSRSACNTHSDSIDLRIMSAIGQCIYLVPTNSNTQLHKHPYNIHLIVSPQQILAALFTSAHQQGGCTSVDLASPPAAYMGMHLTCTCSFCESAHQRKLLIDLLKSVSALCTSHYDHPKEFLELQNLYC